MTKKLLKELLANVRSHNTGSSYMATTGWDRPYEHNCELCGNIWKPETPEAHKVSCMIARGDKALGQKPRIIPLRAL